MSLVDSPAVPDARYLVTKRNQSPNPEMTDNHDYLKKAALTTADLATGGGLLTPTQANQFIDMMMSETVLSKEARVVRMNAPKQDIDKIGFNSRISVPGVEGVDPGQTDAPDLGQVQLSTEEGVAITAITDNSLEDNIERGRIADHIVSLLAARVGLDGEEQWVNGDSASGDAWLAQNEGVLKLATSHVTPHTSMTDATDLAEAFDLAYMSVPNKYLRDRSAFRFYVHADVEYQFRKTLAERATSGGDRYLLEDTPVTLRGVPVVPLPVLPVYDDAGTNRSDALLVRPKNVVIGVQRAIKIEPNRLPRERKTEYVATSRTDVEFEEEDAVAKITGIETTG